VSAHTDSPAPPPAHAAVHFPPPLIYAAGILVGWLLNRWRPLPITADASTARASAALIFLVIWFALFSTALRAFRRAHTTLIPNRPATSFVTDGPYRFSRNPMYLSMAALYLSVSLFINSWWCVLLLAVVILIVDRAVIGREERYLSAAFPAEYATYRARARRWV